ncbi:MAG: fasciclin domain-containing protein [Phenylobacterium sp.]|uniref:fasciclin domain-containing protein n=1 Tax=Phenylobacterium sp. TaxID=1871053 RepID=UPI00391CBDEF
MRLKLLLAATAATALTAGAAAAQTPPASPAPAQAPAVPAPAAEAASAGDIVETAKASGQFDTFLKAAEATNLTGLLKTQPNITVFAPTDAAFAALPPGELDKLMLPENRAELQRLLVYHLVNAPVRSTDFEGVKRSAATVAGPSVELEGGEPPKVNNATIVQADVAASNGVIHVIDKVLRPEGAASAPAAAATASDTQPAREPPN